MLDRVIYFSGVHGSGKSTLIRDIAQHEGCIGHQRAHSVTLDDTYLRAVWRLIKYYIEAREQSALADATDSLILGNRCVYDNFAYLAAFKELHWVSDEEIRHHADVFHALFPAPLHPKKVIHIAPSSDWVRDRLHERWRREEKKWREDDFAYLDAVVRAYDDVYRQAPCTVFRLEETDRTKRVEQVLQWLQK